MAAHNYTAAAADGRAKRQDEKHVELVVRPGRRYGQAKGGELVLIDAAEYERGTTRDALCTVEEHERSKAAVAQAAAVQAAPKPATDSITQQLQRLWSGAVKPPQVDEKAPEAAPAE